MSSASSVIEPRLWRQFLALAECLHFGRAAEALHMTQPPLTLAIQQLERRLGVALFVRGRRGVALTAEGAALIAPVRRWLAEGEALAALARDAGRGEVGRLRLGFVSTLGFGPLPAWLRGFRERHPRIALDLREATSDVQQAALERGDLDAGFVLHASGAAGRIGADDDDSERGLHARAVLDEPLVLALPEAHELARAKRLAPAAVLNEPLVVFPRASAPSLFDALLACYRSHGATPVIAQEAIQMQTIVNLVSAGLGLAWVPQAVTNLERPGVVYRAAPAALHAPRCRTSLRWRRDAPAVVARFVAFIGEALTARHGASAQPHAAVSAARRDSSPRRRAG